MNLRSIDLNLLTAFDAVFTEGNMSRAAEKVGMSQPAMSLAISRLRHITNDNLFESTGRGVKSTVRAQQLAGPIRRALDLVSSALEQSVDFDPSVSTRTFNLVLADYGEAILVPPLMKLLHDLNSPIRINTVAMAGLDIEKEMHFGKVDFYAWVEPWKDLNFTSESIGVLKEVCLLRSDHPLVNDTLSTEQYASLKHLVLKLPDGQATSAIDRELWARGIKREHDMIIHTYFNAPLILACTDLICSMPLALAKHFTERYPLKIVPSPVARNLSAFLTWHNSMKDDPGHSWMRKTLAKISEDTLNT